MNVLIIGSGGRENMICRALSGSVHLDKLYCYGPHINPGMKRLGCEIKVGPLSNKHSIISYAREKYITLAIIGPETPLKNNLALDFQLHNISCIGPIAKYAQIETDKGFARDILSNICPEANPTYSIFKHTDSIQMVKDYICENNENNGASTQIVIKANGLKGGKGVKVQGDHFSTLEEGLKYIEELISSGDDYVIEEKLVGREFSLMSFTDGIHLKHMPVVQDFKRAYNNDRGPNTGSMGSISFANHRLPFLTEEDVARCQKINEDTIAYLNWYFRNDVIASKYCYKGILYGSFMKTLDGQIKVIEFNCRFGDPEVINVLGLLRTEFLDICIAIVNGTLDKEQIEYKSQATVCRYLVPIGYPLYEKEFSPEDIYISNYLITSNKYSNELANGLLFSSVEKIDNDDCKQFLRVRTLGSRAIALIGIGSSIDIARKQVALMARSIGGPLLMRTDIGVISNDDRKLLEEDRYGDVSSKYAESGVDIDEGNRFVGQLREYAHSTFNDCVESKIGDFGGIFNISKIISKLSLTGEICLISSTDGVGTKSVFIDDYFGPSGYSILGQDIVNHCINDILVQGGHPLYFLDYFASSKLDSATALEFIKGVSSSCKKYNCALIGGETAEMPDVYLTGRCDVAGTITGIVEKDKIIDGKRDIRSGDRVIGLRSSGPHTNGYSLIRTILSSIGSVGENKANYPDIIRRLGAPHRCYLEDYNELVKNNITINGLCHITGGGLIENVKRILDDDLYINYSMDIYNYPPEFKFLKENGNVSDIEMTKVFNCGIGMLVFLNNDADVEAICSLLNKLNNANDYAFDVGDVYSLDKTERRGI